MSVTFDGYALFGSYNPVMTPRDTPTERQENAYAGLQGVESIPLGDRGRHIEMTGILVGGFTTGALLRAAQASIWAYRDGRAYVLVDTTGTSWIAILEAFDPAPKMFLDPVRGYGCKYTARFRVLGPS